MRNIYTSDGAYVYRHKYKPLYPVGYIREPFQIAPRAFMCLVQTNKGWTRLVCDSPMRARESAVKFADCYCRIHAKPKRRTA